jgi:hypothetical protein
MCGGILSIFIRMVVLVYLTVLADRMFNRTNNKNETLTVQADVSKDISYGDSDVRIITMLQS